MLSTPAKVACIAVDQPIGTFYVASIAAGQILPLLTIERRGLTAEGRLKVQRALDVKRQAEIARFATSPQATFPTSVTLSTDSRFVHVVEEGRSLVVGLEVGDEDVEEVIGAEAKTKTLEIQDGPSLRRFVALPDGEPIAMVIDGQHRVEGLRKAGATEKESPLATFQLLFSFMFDLTPEDMAKVFVTINSTQRKVDSSLISDLFGLSTKRSPRRTCHLIAVAFNEKEKGPFERGLKMLGKRQSASELLSQGSFCKYILRLISRTPDEDERRLALEQPLDPDPRAPLRAHFIQKHDETILRILDNYFTVVADLYSGAWSTKPEAYLVRKTVGFSALTQLLARILPTALEKKDASIPAFTRVFKRIVEKVPESEWAVGKFSSSEADATKMSNRMFECVASDLGELIAAKV